MFTVLEALKKHGYPVLDVSKNEMHIFLSAYTTAIAEPVILDYSEEETRKCLKSIEGFFLPGWKRIMGL